MSTNNKTNLSQQQFTEIYGQIIGLYGDPTNQNTTTDGIDMSTVFNNITWTAATNNQKVLFWSRALICAIMTPFDGEYKKVKVALVLRPRAVWLYGDLDGITVRDYAGNGCLLTNIGTADADGKISNISPTYHYGDIIRISTLPVALSVSDWVDDGATAFSSISSEYYDAASTNIRQTQLDWTTSTMNIAATKLLNKPLVDSSHITDFNVSKIVYYDKNVDARTRFGGSSSGNVTVSVCIGGVPHLYQLKGKQIS